MLAIAFHVDYWDGLGWHDPFSMTQATQRQQDFGEKLGLQTVGTPQMIIDGQRSVFGANKAAVLQALDGRRDNVMPVDAARWKGICSCGCLRRHRAMPMTCT